MAIWLLILFCTKGKIYFNNRNGNDYSPRWTHKNFNIRNTQSRIQTENGLPIQNNTKHCAARRVEMYSFAEVLINCSLIVHITLEAFSTKRAINSFSWLYSQDTSCYPIIGYVVCSECIKYSNQPDLALSYYICGKEISVVISSVIERQVPKYQCQNACVRYTSSSWCSVNASISKNIW